MSIIQPHIPKDAKLGIVGGFPSKEEVRQGRPFVGNQAWALDGWLEAVGLSASQCVLLTLTSVECVGLNRQKVWKDLLLRQTMMERILDHTKTCEVVVLLGSDATQFVLGKTLKMARGYFTREHDKLFMPIYDPASVFKNYDFDVMSKLDFYKVARYLKGTFPIKTRRVHILENAEEVRKYLPMTVAACDIETVNACYMTHFGWSTDPCEAYTIPFASMSPEVEHECFLALREYLIDPTRIKVFHGGLYDVPFIMHHYKTPVNGWVHDTMIQAHTIFPELPKALQFVASMRCNIPNWKELNKSKKTDLGNIKDK